MFTRWRVPVLILLAMLHAATASAQALYWVDTRFPAPTINKADANGNALSSVPLPAGSLPEGLAIDATGKVYWAEAAISSAKINRAASDLTGITPIVTGISLGRGVAVDPIAQRVYWTTSNLFIASTVRRAALDGSGVTVLLSLPQGYNVRGIAVDHAGGKIWWADFDQNAIYQANLDGTGMTQWLTVAANSGPYGVAVDPVAGFVYWTEYVTGNLRRSSTTTPGVTTILTGLGNPTYLTIDVAGARLYWSEGVAGNQHIKRATTAGGSVTTLPCPLTTYGGLVYQPSGSVAAPGPSTPVELAFLPQWANPGRGPFPMRFALPRDARVRLTVLDPQGREVASLADGVMSAGEHDTSWRPRSSDPAGVYFVRLTTSGREWVRRIALIR